MRVVALTLGACVVAASAALAASSEELCRTLDVNKLSKGDVRVLAHNARDLMESDTGWKVMKISEGLVDNWPFFGSYERARANLVSTSHGMLDWKKVDTAIGISLKYSCRIYW